MIGKSRFRDLTDRIEPGRGIPSVGQVAFNATLKRSCGCCLLWQRVRRVFVVARLRGRFTAPQTYFDLGPAAWPLSLAGIGPTSDAVQWCDGRLAGDHMQMLDAINRASRDKSDAERNQLIDTFAPEFAAARRRYLEIRSDGRFRPRFFDVAARN